MMNSIVDHVVSELSTDDMQELILFITRKVKPFVSDPDIMDIIDDVESCIRTQIVDDKTSSRAENIAFSMSSMTRNIDPILKMQARLMWNTEIYMSLIIKDGIRQHWRMFTIIMQAAEILSTTPELLVNEFLSFVFQRDVLSESNDPGQDDI